MKPMQPGIYPFWFWNGDLTADEIRWQVAQMADQGMKGFYIHPRQGLRQPYLSDAFFAMVEVAVEAAAAHGMTAELYDEYPYPSGVAGGEVVLGHPEYMATRLLQEHFDVDGGHVRRELPAGAILCCRAYPLRDGSLDWDGGIDLRAAVGPVLREDSYHEGGLTPYNRKRYFASSPTPTLETTLDGPHRVFVSAQMLVTTHKYWGAFVDTLNPEAIQRFLELTHARYHARFGTHFGERIGSIFVDETAPHWSTRLPAAFKDRCGYDLLPQLPALQDESHPRHIEVGADLFRVKYELFCEAFEAPIRDWCHAHNLRYAGEKTSLRLAQLAWMDIPGCDPGHTKAGAPLDCFSHIIRSNARAVASAAYFYGKEGALDECYHSMGWSATLQDAKVVAEALLLAGIRYLVPHGFFYTTHGLTKHDAPPTFFYQLPAWRHFGALTRRLDRIATAFEGTHMTARVLVVDPHSGLPTADQPQAYQALIHGLLAAHVDFLVVDTDILEGGQVADGRLRVRDVEADVVVVPPMRVVEAPLAAWLAGFVEAGGSVERLGDEDGCEALVARLAQRVGAILEMRAVDGDGERVYAVTRSDGERRTWLLLNTAATACELELGGVEALREVELDETGDDDDEGAGGVGVSDGNVATGIVAGTGGRGVSVGNDTTDGGAPWRLTRATDGWRRRLAPFESALLVEETEPAAATPLPTVRLDIPVALEVTPQHANLLRLGTWELSLRDGPEAAAPVPAVPLATQLSMAGQAFVPRYQPGFGVMPSWHQPELTVVYRCRVDCDYAGAVELVVEPGSLVGDWRLMVNDGTPVTQADLAPTETHVRGSLGVDLTSRLRRGTNELVVVVTTDRRDGGLRNPLYLAGDFGVSLDPATLVGRSPAGAFEAWEDNGLPFYAGAVDYAGQVELASAPASGPVRLELAFPCAFQDATEVRVNDGPWRPALWSPYTVTVDAGELRAGANQVQLRVFTSLVRAFDGLRFDIDGHRYEAVDPTDPGIRR